MTTDPRLTPTERDALARLLVGTRKGGEGWHRESSAAAQVRDILEAGETRDERDERLLETALRMWDIRHGHVKEPLYEQVADR